MTRLAFLPLTTCHIFVQNVCFTGENPLLLATKLFWTHTQDANPMSGRPLLMEWLFHQIFRANLSAISSLKNPEVQQLFTAWAVLWQPGFCLGSHWQKMKAFLFHADIGQMFNISFSFHSLLFQNEIIPNTEVFKQKK